MKIHIVAAAAVALGAQGLPVAAQMAPGVRAPTGVAQGVGQAWLLGCFFASSQRPAPGLNLGFELVPPSLHPPTRIPDDLRPLIMSLEDHVRPAVLDTPGGEVWMFYDPRSHRCLIATSPADEPGMAEAIAPFLREDQDWRRIENAAGAPAGAAVYELHFEPAPSLRRPGGTLRVWYQPAADGRPQMIVTERADPPARRRRRR